MNLYDNVTLVCVDCTSNRNSALKAMEQCILEIDFARVLFFSDTISGKIGDVEFIKINPIKSKEEYSNFIMNKLPDYIRSSHCLIIQYDGYVLNPSVWTDEFLKYDYIGAPWWYDDPEKNVGNGGFSLRSLKLMKACQASKFEVYHPEDDIICRHQKPYLEQKYGLKWAPEKLAERFSFEPNMKHMNFVFDNHFGFHGIPEFILK